MDFKTKVIRSFRSAKEDMVALKQNLTGWLSFLNSNQKMLKAKVAALEKRVEELERRQRKEIVYC